MANEIDKKVGQSMLDDLLHEGDKKKKPAPVRSYPTYDRGYKDDLFNYSNHYGYGGRSVSAVDDDGDDPLDRTYRSSGANKARPSFTNYKPATVAGRKHEVDREENDFFVRSEAINKILSNATTKEGCILTVPEMDTIVDTMMREIGDLFEDANALWLPEATFVLRGALREVVSEHLKYSDQGEASYRRVEVLGWSDKAKREAAAKDLAAADEADAKADREAGITDDLMDDVIFGADGTMYSAITGEVIMSEEEEERAAIQTFDGGE